jgi:hypothetical protein
MAFEIMWNFLPFHIAEIPKSASFCGIDGTTSSNFILYFNFQP